MTTQTELEAAAPLQAKFSQSRNDMFWSIFDLSDGKITWSGYDDDFWWNNVSKTGNAQSRVGSVTGNIYNIDFDTGLVEVASAQVAS